MNKCIFHGRLVRDPVVRGSEDKPVVSFTLAVMRPYSPSQAGKKPQSDYPEFVCFGKTASFVAKSLRKGSEVLVESSFRTDSYTDKDGNTAYSKRFIVDRILFYTSARKAEGQNQSKKVSNSDYEEVPF